MSYELNDVICNGKIHYEIVDANGNHVESFDYNEHGDARRELDRLNSIGSTIEPIQKCYSASYLIARSRWVTRDGKKLQVPIEEYRSVEEIVMAPSVEDAIKQISRKGYLVTNISLRD